MTAAPGAAIPAPPSIAHYRARPASPGRLEGGRGLRRHSPPAAPLVSVVTVVFNAAATLERTLRSVLAQDIGPVEYVVVDGGSTDGTLDIIRDYADRLEHWVSEPDAGIYDAMNKGIALTSGGLVGLLNADDWYLEGALGAAVRASAAAPATIVYGDIVHRGEEWGDALFRPPARLHRRHFHKMPIPHAATLVPRACYETLGLYIPALRLAADFEFMLRSYRAGVAFHYMARAIAGVQAGGMSDTHTAGYHAEVRRVMDANGLGRRMLARQAMDAWKERAVKAARRWPLGRRALAGYRTAKALARRDAR